jgi:hypothetical protein
MKSLLVVSAALEAATGLALMLAPSLVVWLLAGSPLDSPAGLMVGRVAGTALVSLAIGCWSARHGEPSRAATGVVVAMLFYNVALVALLLYAGIGLKLVGITLWPAVVVHAALGVWCGASLWSRRA